MTSGHTSPEIFPFIEARHREAGLHPVTALKESSGFIFNRIWAAVKREVLSMLAEGVSTPETVDSMWIEALGGQKIGPWYVWLCIPETKGLSLEELRLLLSFDSRKC